MQRPDLFQNRVDMGMLAGPCANSQVNSIQNLHIPKRPILTVTDEFNQQGLLECALVLRWLSKSSVLTGSSRQISLNQLIYCRNQMIKFIHIVGCNGLCLSR